MDATAGFWVAVAVGMVPLAGLFWWWNDYWHALPFRLHGRGSAKLPPGYMGIPFLGELPAFLWYFKVLRRPDDFINAKRRRYGDGVGLYRTYLLGSPTIIACSPSANKLVLQDESSFGVPWNYTQLMLIGATGVGAVEGAAHSKVKAFLVRAVNQPDALRKFTPLLQTRIAASLESWSRKGRITVYKEANKAILGNIGKCFASIETEHAMETIDDLVKGMLGGLRAFPINFPGTALYYSFQCSGKLKAIFRQELEKRKCDASEPKNDVMEALMQMKEQEGKRLSEDEIVDNMMALFAAGYETTSISIMWTFYYLAKHSDVLLKLREEHMLVSKKLGDMLTYEDITSWKYTSKVVEEILRMGSTTTFMVRTAKKDVDYRGYRIPKGWKVACWFRYLHTNPEHFKDPMSFNPERWNEAPKAGSNLVFGGGVRVCAGNMFARLQITLLVHHLVLRYRWRLVNPNEKVLYIPYPRPADEVEIDITRI
ncbi:ent-kaurenoic acid oxidase 2-like [Salvia miltiorrhiza]|uniref:ent-kaurenoic acid oxidase 2-like n=1 Tax=Salvia miltiorrhiza TaxID=226208 RepID=UPI0025ACAC67|nr:ent-kaurenoic acid oxidase 2-like [Salvia miltiorrhiza]